MKKRSYSILEGYSEISRYKSGSYDLDCTKKFTNKKDAYKFFNSQKKELDKRDPFYRDSSHIHITELAKEVLEGDKEDFEQNTDLLDSLEYEILEEYVENIFGKVTDF